MRGKTRERQGRGPEQRGLGTTLKLFLDAAISGAINLSRCGCRSHARASSMRCTPRGRRGGGLVNLIVLVSHYISLIALSGGKSRKSVGISHWQKNMKRRRNFTPAPSSGLRSDCRQVDAHCRSRSFIAMSIPTNPNELLPATAKGSTG